MAQPATFLKTKVHIPLARKAVVPRPALLARMIEGLSSPLTLVTAPAGFGKTTLVISGTQASGMPTAWLSLDKGDQSPDRFLGYLILALQQLDARLGLGALDILASAPQVQPEAVLVSLINDLTEFDQNLVLVLDDYQSISSPVLHEAVTFLLDHAPETLHLVIATRSDPPIPLARLRARGQVVELRASDLRFTGEEAAQFLNDLMGLQLDDMAVRVLEERTEGWIAGLQMAALSMRDRSDVNRFIDSFSGTNRFILDYLLEEVLANQPPEVQRFLLLTSVLDRLCAPLCDALLVDGEELSNSSSMLDELERANLFLVPLDDERFWYRYHHLFADLLRARLNRLYPGLEPELHRRAAGWLEKEGSTVEAINHALAGGDHDHAARMVEENTTRLLAQGELKALMGWIAVLPEDLRQSRPWLCVHQAHALAFAGRLGEVDRLLRQAESVAQDDNERECCLDGAITAIRSMAAVMAGKDIEAVQLAKQALDLLPEDQAWYRSSADWALGYAERSLGHLAEARLAFEDMIQLARRMGNIWTLVTGLMDLANVARSQGQLVQARALFEESLREAKQQGARSLGYIARMESGLAGVLYEQNQLDAAGSLLTAALHHLHQWPNPNHLVYAYSIQSRWMMAHYDLPGARAAVLEADYVRRSEPLTRITQCIVEVGIVRVWLTMPKEHLAVDEVLSRTCSEVLHGWQDSLDERDARDEADMAALLMLARVSLLRGQVDQALILLSKVKPYAEKTGNIPTLIEGYLLYAVAEHLYSSSNENPSLASLAEALRLAQPGGFVRIFLDEDLLHPNHPVREMLARWLSQAGKSSLREYAVSLHKQFEGETKPETAPPSTHKLAQSLPEPLSQREIEVLALIAEGLTNEAIARQLIISAGTVKAHTAAIYRKLDVANRTEAVARARQLHILP